MYNVNTSSNAYQLDMPVQMPKKSVRNVKKKKKKTKRHNLGFIGWGVIVFGVAFLICFRFVQIYGLHAAVEANTAELEKVVMDNEQTTIAINSKIDSSKIEEYAKSELGLQKVENRQIIYLRPEQGDSMEKVAKTDENTGAKGIFGMFSGVLEYLK